MPLISCSCPNCNSNLDFDDAREIMFCSFCGTKVLREQVTQITNNITVAEGYQIHDADWYYENAMQLICEHRWCDVERIANKMFDAFPLDERVQQLRYISVNHLEEFEYEGKGYLFCLGESRPFIAFNHGKVTDYISSEEKSESVDWFLRKSVMSTYYNCIIKFETWLEGCEDMLPIKYKEECEEIIEDYRRILSKYNNGVEERRRLIIKGEKDAKTREIINKLRWFAIIIMTINGILLLNSTYKSDNTAGVILIIIDVMLVISKFFY